MKLKDLFEEYVNVSMGPSPRMKAMEQVPRYWYHSPYKRRLARDGGIDPYPPSPKEVEVLNLFRNREINKIIFLSPTPYDRSSYVVVDLKKLDLSKFRLTGQSEGYAVYNGRIPPEAIVKSKL